MHESEAYYEEILYPLQNGVLCTLAACEAPFYLTGGTALHRHYFGFRYSEDLDLFVNQDTSFSGYVDRVLAALRERGYRFDADAFVRNDQYARVLITANEATLKVDFVNDSAPRFGAVVCGTLFPRIDSLRNILSNKVTAMYRLESKDIVDLWAICSHEAFHWSDVLAEATGKEVGIDAATVADLVRSFPRHLFDTVRWRERPDEESFFCDLAVIASDLLAVRENSLYRARRSSSAW